MRNDKQNALALRMAGKSYKDIETQLRIPKSTLSGWFASVDWSKKVKENLLAGTREDRVFRLRKLSEKRGKKLKDFYIEAEAEARSEFEILKNNPLFIAALMIYWGEGDKSTKYRISVSNSDPSMLRLFSLFLEKLCGVEKTRIKAWILAYPDTDHLKALEFWSRTISVWPTNFTKTITIKGRSTKRTLPFGTCYIVISSAYLKVKIVTWIKLLSQELIKNAGMV